MNLFSYILVHDGGFAPNPFHGVCTLACCKPSIRRVAGVGDIIVGLTPKPAGNRIVYIMRVQHALSFAEYWHDPQFRKKRPAGVADCGDNIYQPLGDGQFRQLSSAHSHKDGSESSQAKARDLNGQRVLLSRDFVYFGADAADLPERFAELVAGRGHRRFRTPADARLIAAFAEFLADIQPRGRRAVPAKWRGRGPGCTHPGRKHC